MVDSSYITLVGRVSTLSTFKELREEAQLSASELARASGVSRYTIYRIEHKPEHSINYRSAMSLLRVLGEKLHRTVLISDVDGLNVQ